MHPFIMFLAGVAFGFFGAVEMYRQLDERKSNKYYDEFLQNMADLTEDQFEKVLQNFRDFRKVTSEKK